MREALGPISLHPQPPDIDGIRVDCEGSAAKFTSPFDLSSGAAGAITAAAEMHGQGGSLGGEHCWLLHCVEQTPSLPGGVGGGLAPREAVDKFHFLSLGSLTDG